MKQETFFGVRKDSEKHLYVRRCDNNEVLITKTVNGESITEENTVHLNAEEARKLGIQLTKHRPISQLSPLMKVMKPDK